MHCAICDKDDEAVTAFNPDCPECQEVIRDTIASYEDDDKQDSDDDDNPVIQTEVIMYKEDNQYFEYDL